MLNWGESPIFILKNNNSLIGISLLTNCSFSYPELAKVLLRTLFFPLSSLPAQLLQNLKTLFFLLSLISNARSTLSAAQT